MYVDSIYIIFFVVVADAAVVMSSNKRFRSVMLSAHYCIGATNELICIHRERERESNKKRYDNGI